VSKETRKIHTYRTNTTWLLLFAAMAATLVSGCGDSVPRNEVTGKVTYQGQPVTGGIIYFVPDSGPQATAVLGNDGSYQLVTPGLGDGAVTGVHAVYFVPMYDEPTGEYTEADYVANKPPPEKKSRLNLPPKYLAPHSSNLSAEVSEGENKHDFDL
jgi:hypothetical protein